STVGKATPTVTTTATSGTAGGTITDTVHISGLVNAQAGATVTFQICGPRVWTPCTTGIATRTNAVTGNGDVTSDAAPVNTAGDYYVPARCWADANRGVHASPTRRSSDLSTVGKATPTVTTTATSGTAGGTITDTVHISGLVNAQAGATVTF